MSKFRHASAALLLFGLSNAFAACVAQTLPPGAYPSSNECRTNIECKYIPIPKCTRNMKQCYDKHCLISDIPNCVVTPTPTATATTPGPAPTIEPTPANLPGSNPTPAVPN
jgi:hypothetical protein